MKEEPEIILIVDDEESVKRLPNSKLTIEGYECLEASNARQALQEVHCDNFALVICPR